MLQHTRLIVPAMLLGAGFLLSGCAQAGGPGATPGTTAPTPGPSTDLVVSIRADGTNESARHHLQCNGPLALEAGDHPRAAAACALLDANPQLLTPPPENGSRMCTQQYGGPAVARVSGTRDGRPVSRGFDLRDGCGISDWMAALPLLVEQPIGPLE